MPDLPIYAKLHPRDMEFIFHLAHAIVLSLNRQHPGFKDGTAEDPCCLVHTAAGILSERQAELL